ncbi:MAG TPA: tetratricopeptide repeat protein, partial [Gammaproteobacteria bacterium]
RFFHQQVGHSLSLREVLMSNSGPLGRPVSMFTFWLNSVLTPDNLAAWKLTNILIHVLCGLLAGLLAMELFAAAPSDHGIEPRYLGAFVGIVWLLHPLQVSTVLYTVQRMTELATLFSFAGLYAFVLSRRAQTHATLGRTLLGLTIMSLAAILASLSKENGLLLPFLALAIEVLLFHGAGTTDAARAIKYYFGGLCALTLTGILLLLALRPQFISGGYAFRDFTLGQRLLSEPRILFDYLSMLLWPTPDRMGFFHDDVMLSTSIIHPLTTLLSLLGLITLAASAWIARKRFPLYAAGVAIFLIGQSMESSFVALQLMFEHRNYLPGFGVFLGITALGGRLLERRSQLLQGGLAAAILVSLTLLLAVRVMYWSSDLTLYTAAVRAHPKSDAAVAGLAQTYLDSGKPDAALQVLAAHKSFGAQLQRAYIECRMHGNLPATRFASLLNMPMGHLGSYPVTGLAMLGGLGIKKQCQLPDAAYSRLIDRAAEIDTTGPSLRYMLYIYSGYYHQRLNQLPQAIIAMQNAHRMSPNTPVPLILSARWYLQAGDPIRATNQLEQASSIDRKYHAGFAHDIAELQAQIAAAGNKLPANRPR